MGCGSGWRPAGMPLPVYVGMRNWHPFLADTLARDVARPASGAPSACIAAAQRSYSSCTQYKENVAAARATLRERGLADVEVTYVGDWHDAPRIHRSQCGARARRASHAAAGAARTRAELVFTAHSIPVSMADKYPYRRQFEETCAPDRGAASTPAAHPRRNTTTQRSTRAAAAGPRTPGSVRTSASTCATWSHAASRAAVLSPAGFLIDHVEVLYDLDVEAAAIAGEIGLRIARAGTVGDHPLFLDMLADVVTATVTRYAEARPLPLVAHA